MGNPEHGTEEYDRKLEKNRLYKARVKKDKAKAAKHKLKMRFQRPLLKKIADLEAQAAIYPPLCASNISKHIDALPRLLVLRLRGARARRRTTGSSPSSVRGPKSSFGTRRLQIPPPPCPQTQKKQRRRGTP